MGAGREAQEGGDLSILLAHLGFPAGSAGKESACNAGDLGSIPGSGRCLWRRAWQPTPASLGFLGVSDVRNLPAMQETWVPSLCLEKRLCTPVSLPGESHGQRSLAGCSPRGHKESDTTERLNSTHGWFTSLYGRKKHNIGKSIIAQQKKIFKNTPNSHWVSVLYVMKSKVHDKNVSEE